MFLDRYSYDSFWADNEPCFHAYDYGANVAIEVTEDMRDRSLEDDEEEGDEDEYGIVKEESLFVEETADQTATESDHTSHEKEHHHEETSDNASDIEILYVAATDTSAKAATIDTQDPDASLRASELTD